MRPLHMIRQSALPLVVGLVAGATVTLTVKSSAQPAAGPKKEDPPYRNLDANLYVQTSAEYRACCYQAYNVATSRLAGVVCARPGGPVGKPPAVVLDLDETVLDNGGFQAAMVRAGLAYDQKLWERWEAEHADEVRLVPGAKEFLTRAADLGVVAVYISNRNEKYRESTKSALARLGIAVPDHQLLLSDGTSDKTARRTKAREMFDVVLLVGDNLRDFDDRFKYDTSAGTAGRAAEVDATRDRFLTEWVILPNPAYGEWTKPFGQGAADAGKLYPTQMKVP